MAKFLFLLYCFLIYIFLSKQEQIDSTNKYKIWGPGLQPHLITLPVRYFYVEPNFSSSYKEVKWKVDVIGKTNKGNSCRVWWKVLDRKDNSVIIRYKLQDICLIKEIIIKANDEIVGESPYIINKIAYPDECSCNKLNVEEWINTWQCGEVPNQIDEDLKLFLTINWDTLRDKVIKKYDLPTSVSLCHYIIKNNSLHRKCYGQYVGFKMFMDSILLSILRKVNLPDLEFFVNLGDWPLVKDKKELFPIFSWCGSTETFDIVMPTYDITESTLEMMGRVSLDMLSVQGNVIGTWDLREPKAFWRGRDSNTARLNLMLTAKKHPELFNVSMTNYFFYRDKQHIYGAPTPHVSFFDFFNYKYQLNIDGTVAAYRFPYLLAGGSLVFKQDSKYYEHFYNKLKKNEHYIPLNNDLSDLVDKLNWAISNDEKAQEIANAGKEFAVKNLLPQNIICYYTQLLYEFSKRITSEVNILKDMEEVPQPTTNIKCNCDEDFFNVVEKEKDEL